MREAQPVRVQKLAPELGVGHAVDRVTDHRKVDRRQVNADLVRPAGLQPDREQRVLDPGQRLRG